MSFAQKAILGIDDYTYFEYWRTWMGNKVRTYHFCEGLDEW